jgi:hypothetical protein
VQQVAPLQTSLPVQPHEIVLPQPSAITPQVPGGSVPHTFGAQHVLDPRLQTSPAMVHGQLIVPPWPFDRVPQASAP